MKKILLVDNSSWSIYQFRYPLVQALTRKGYDVIIASPVDEYIHYLNQTDFNRHISIHHLDRTGKNPIKDLQFLVEILRICRKEKPDVVVSFTLKPNIYCGILNQLTKTPTIAVVTGLGYSFLHQTGIFRWMYQLYRIAFRKLDKLVVYNKGDYRFFSENNIVSTSQITLLHGEGVNALHYDPHLFQPEKQTPFTFLFAGRLLKDKGIEELVKAMQMLREREVNVQCQVIGDMQFGNPSDIDKDQLLAWIEHRDIVYLGGVNDVRPIIASADALVLPSYREGLSRVILEAMSMGKPIITTDVPGCQDLIMHHKNGLLVPVKNAAALADAMEYLSLLHPTEIEAMGRRNRKEVLKKYDSPVATKSFVSLVGQVLGEKKNYRADLVAQR